MLKQARKKPFKESFHGGGVEQRTIGKKAPKPHGGIERRIRCHDANVKQMREARAGRRWGAGSLAPDLETFRPQHELRLRFARLADAWRVERGTSSNIAGIHLHSSYQQIIGLGPAAVPLILDEMRRAPDFWFWALRAITGQDPVPSAHAGDLPAMTRDWLQWARTKGYACAIAD